MPHDRRQIDILLRHHAQQVIREAGAGSWEPYGVTEVTPDGKAVVAINVAPLAASHAADRQAADFDGRGRPSAGCAVDIYDYLLRAGEQRYMDIVEAMAPLHHAPTTVRTHLKALKGLGFVAQAEKNGPYRAVRKAGA
jgi:hypothetical protein